MQIATYIKPRPVRGFFFGEYCATFQVYKKLEKMAVSPCNNHILELLKEKSSNKQFIFRQTKALFAEMQQVISTISTELNEHICNIDKSVVVDYQIVSEYEARLFFSGDVVAYLMHTNVFTLDKKHPLWKSSYLKEDPKRGYFGVIYMYNFLADSLRFGRVNDYGSLLGRIFINKEKHFFVEGKRQFGFLYNNLPRDIFDEVAMRQIVEKSMIHALEFDLTPPEITEVREMAVGQILASEARAQTTTRKKVGYKFSFDADKAPK